MTVPARLVTEFEVKGKTQGRRGREVERRRGEKK